MTVLSLFLVCCVGLGMRLRRLSVHLCLGRRPQSVMFVFLWDPVFLPVGRDGRDQGNFVSCVREWEWECLVVCGSVILFSVVVRRRNGKCEMFGCARY